MTHEQLLPAQQHALDALTRAVAADHVAAIETVRRNKEQYAAAEARARARHPVHPSYFDAFEAVAASGGLAAAGRSGFSEVHFVQSQVDG